MKLASLNPKSQMLTIDNEEGTVKRKRQSADQRQVNPVY